MYYLCVKFSKYVSLPENVCIGSGDEFVFDDGPAVLNNKVCQLLDLKYNFPISPHVRLLVGPLSVGLA